MARIDGVDPARVDDEYVGRVLAAQAKQWGAPLPNHLLYARRPSPHGAEFIDRCICGRLIEPLGHRTRGRAGRRAV